MKHVKPSAIRDLLQFGADPSIISFGGGYPDATLFPLEQLEEVFSRSIIEHGRDALQYTVSNGSPHLRAQIAGRMADEGVPARDDNVLILHGGQQGLDLVAKLLVDEGDVIITEDPTFLGGLIAFNPCEPTYVPVAMDDGGHGHRRVEARAAGQPRAPSSSTRSPTSTTRPASRCRCVAASTSSTSPTATTSSSSRTAPTARPASKGHRRRPIKSLDTEDRVIYLGSFSKILAPGLRLGWAVASEEIIERLGLLKLASDTQCSTLNMAAVSLYLDSYDIESHIEDIRRVYRRKKDLMLDTIRAQFPDDVAFTDPQGGLFTWLTFPDGFDSEVFMREVALPLAKVAYVPGATFFPLSGEPNHARLSYSTQPDERIVEGISRLGASLHTVTR